MTTETPVQTTPKHHEFIGQAVNFTRMDDRIYDATIAEGEAVRQLTERIEPLAKSFQDIAANAVFDVFNTMHRTHPTRSKMGSPLQQEVVNRIMEAEDVQRLRQDTVGDPVAAFLSAVTVSEEMFKAVDRDTAEAAKREQQARKEAEDAQTYADIMAGDEEASEEDQQDAADAATKANQAAQQAANNLKQLLKGKGAAMAAAAKKSVQSAHAQVGPMKQMASCMMPGTGSIDPTGGMPPAEKFKLAAVIAKSGGRFKLIADAMGRMTREAISRQAAKTQHDSGSIVDIGLGSDLSLLMEDEVAMLAHPVFAPFTMARICDDAAMVYDVEEKDEIGQGPFVLLVDESGSMAGQREAEAKGVAIALAHVAARQRRKFVCHFFQDTVTFTVVIEPGDARKHDERGVNLAVAKMAQIAERGTGGGTSFTQPLNKACDTVADATMGKADVLIITDGEADADAAVIQRVNTLRQARGTRFYAMMIGVGSDESVKPFTDKVWTANNLYGAASDLFSLV